MKEVRKEQRKDKKEIHRLLYGRMQAAMLLFLVMIGVLLAERRSVVYEKQEQKLEVLEPTAFQKAFYDKESECLILWDSADANSIQAKNEMEAVLSQMRVGYQMQDVQSDFFQLIATRNYILALSNFSAVGDPIFDLFENVKFGSNLLVMCPPDIDAYFRVVCDKMGIRETGDERFVLDKLVFQTGFMIGGDGKTLEITDPFASSNQVILDEDCMVHLTSGGPEYRPVLWEYTYGSGNVVSINLNIFEKAYRGFYTAAYSLLDDIFIYPVINGAAFYLDDFPSPVPAGEGKYIKRDYNMDIEGFYTNVWWPDMVSLADRYNIRYTSMVIENYSDEHQLPLEGNNDSQRFLYFGNDVLNKGGEIGFHGYNHMPLVLENFDYGDEFDSYNQWSSIDDMRGSLRELQNFCSHLYPKEEFHVYVPPSNILSKEGRQLLSEDFLDIQAVASIYFEGEHEYAQDFVVAEDGIVETPRITSGLIISPYMKTAALSELNFHFVSSHFLHPDDVLDEERGARQGWEALFTNLSDYMTWLYGSAPQIRTLTGTEMAAAVQKYFYLDISTKAEAEKVEIHLSNFQDEAWLLARIKNGTVSSVKGGEAVLVADHLYLIQAFAENVILEICQDCGA